VDPQIEQFFQTAAMRFGKTKSIFKTPFMSRYFILNVNLRSKTGHTLVTPGAYMRDYACGNCESVPFYGIDERLRHQTLRDPSKKLKYPHVSQGSVRTCNIFWRP